jgi:hypothetical protein
MHGYQIHKIRRPRFTVSKTITVKANAMDQTEMFNRIAIRGDVPMAPNQHGLFNVEQVAVLAYKRGCSIKKAGHYAIELKCIPLRQYEWSYATITATDKELWHPVNIFRACREAAGKPYYEVDVKAAKITNPRNLNEVLIAQILAADGVKPYLSQRMEHDVCHYEQIPEFWQGPANTLFKKHVRAKFPESFGQMKVKAVRGDWTKSMTCVMCQRRDASSSEYRRALYALSEGGLIDLKLGNRQGIGTATFEWMPLAYLTAVEAPVAKYSTLEAEDFDALGAAAL